MVAREDNFGDLLFYVFLGHDVTPQNFEPAFARPNFFPEIGRAVTALSFGGIAGGAVVAAIERQELCGGAIELRHHHGLAVTDSEMDECAIGEAEQWFRFALASGARIAVKAVLIDSVLDRLREVAF